MKPNKQMKAASATAIPRNTLNGLTCPLRKRPSIIAKTGAAKKAPMIYGIIFQPDFALYSFSATNSSLFGSDPFDTIELIDPPFKQSQMVNFDWLSM
jgi:hypothetical protein